MIRPCLPVCKLLSRKINTLNKDWAELFIGPDSVWEKEGQAKLQDLK